MSNLIFSLISMLACFLIYPIILFFINKGELKLFTVKEGLAKLILPLAIGAGTYVLSEKLLIPFAKIYASHILASYSSNKWVFGAINGIISGVIIELLRFCVVILLANLYSNVSSKTFLSFSISESWFMAIGSWGIVMFYGIRDYILGSTSSVWAGGLDVFIGLMEVSSATLLYVCLTRFIEFGIYQNKVFIFTGIAMLIHSYIKALQYFMPYIWGMNIVISELIIFFICLALFGVSCKMLNSNN